jgi:hypothetical protein
VTLPRARTTACRQRHPQWGLAPYDEYNTLVQEFDDRFIQPALKETPTLRVRLGKTEENINDVLSETTAELLRTFVSSANPSTGSAHTSDQVRWNALVIAAQQDDAPLVV